MNPHDRKETEAEVAAEIAAFCRERDAALFSFDREKIEAFFVKYDIDIPADERVFWGSVCKAIVNIRTVPADVRKRAEEKLRELGLSAHIR